MQRVIKFPDKLHRKGVLAYKRAQLMMKDKQQYSHGCILKKFHKGNKK